MRHYNYTIVWSDEDNCYIVTSPMWLYLSAFGDTPQEALREFDLVMNSAIEVYISQGWELPNPATKLESTPEETERLRRQVLELQSKLNGHKQQIRQKDKVLREKNLALDAYHHVWCTGGCEGGVHRFIDAPLTEAIVLEAEHNTKRLRTSFNNIVMREAWPHLTDEEKEQIHQDCRVTKSRKWEDVVHEMLERFKDIQVK